MHATTRGKSRTYAAHKTDPATAAFRAAIKHWFPSRNNNTLLWDEIKGVDVTKVDDGDYIATLTLPDEEAAALRFNRDVQPIIEELLPAPKAKPSGTKRELGQSRRRRHQSVVPAKRKPTRKKGGAK